MVFSLRNVFLMLSFGFYANFGFTFEQELHWDWSTIDTSAVSFNKDFIFGTAGSGHQYLGSANLPYSNWAAWDYAKDKHGNPRIHAGEKSGCACDFWRNIDNDIQLLKEMKVKAFRFSIEWSAIEPCKGEINRQELAKYHDLCDKLLAAGIKPVMTLHHFTHPIWFEDLGAFEHEKNIQYFVDYATLMVKELGNKVMLWATFNEPGVYVFQSYIRGVWPPGKIGINRAGQVIKNILQAHVSTYQAIKELPGGADIKVGIVHSVTQFEPHNPNSLLERTAAKYMNHMFHDAITEFFATGNLNFYVPMLAHISYINTQGTKSLDFFGINYYSHVLIQADLFNRKFGQAFRDGEIKTDMPYCIYAEGLYRAIKDISERIAESQQIPIYITENGIADYKDDRRELYIKQYIYALYKALCDGYDVRGYFYWSFLDNFEWDHGYGQKFGLYEVDMQTQKRKLRQGSKAYVDILQKTYGD